VKERFAAQGGEISPSTPEQLTAHLKSEIDKWGKVVRVSGARID
jgi:tripartite-type tricarboxylate transporter receptor subunit TctC